MALTIRLANHTRGAHHRFFAYHSQQSAAGFEHGKQGDRDTSHRTAEQNCIISLNRGKSGDALAVYQFNITNTAVTEALLGRRYEAGMAFEAGDVGA